MTSCLCCTQGPRDGRLGGQNMLLCRSVVVLHMHALGTHPADSVDDAKHAGQKALVLLNVLILLHLVLDVHHWVGNGVGGGTRVPAHTDAHAARAEGGGTGASSCCCIACCCMAQQAFCRLGMTHPPREPPSELPLATDMLCSVRRPAATSSCQ